MTDVPEPYEPMKVPVGLIVGLICAILILVVLVIVLYHVCSKRQSVSINEKSPLERNEMSQVEQSAPTKQ